jgi:hypothetical protein
LWFQTRPGSYNAASLIGFLKDLKRQMGGHKAILVWDGLPGYSPDLNPVEPVWGTVKGRELAKRCAANLGESRTALRSGLERDRRSGSLPFSFLHHTGLHSRLSCHCIMRASVSFPHFIQIPAPANSQRKAIAVHFGAKCARSETS